MATQSCTELHLANQGFKKLANFEPLVNLECLWVNGNKLSYLSGLERNTRIKELYAHDNLIGTLQGSLKLLKFLQVLDLSNNKLRNLEKILDQLHALKFIRNLNLAGNPCCEEPDYRAFVIHRMPWVEVLDQHMVTPAERTKAARLLDPASQARGLVAFGSRAPDFYGSWNDSVQEISARERELRRKAATLEGHEKRHRNREDEMVSSPRGAL